MTADEIRAAALILDRADAMHGVPDMVVLVHPRAWRQLVVTDEWAKRTENLPYRHRRVPHSVRNALRVTPVPSR